MMSCSPADKLQVIFTILLFNLFELTLCPNELFSHAGTLCKLFKTIHFQMIFFFAHFKSFELKESVIMVIQ